MRLFALTALFCASPAVAVKSGYSGFLQRGDVEMDASDADDRSATASASGSRTAMQRMGKVGNGIAGALACLALGGTAGWHAKARTSTANPDRVVGLQAMPQTQTLLQQGLAPSQVVVPVQATQQAQTVLVSPQQSTWAQGYRAGHEVYRQQVPISLPFYAPTTIPGFQQPTYTIIQNPGGAGLTIIPPSGVGETIVMPPGASWESGDPMVPPPGWKWPKNGAEIGFDQSLIGTIVEFDMVNFGQIHCGCQANIYLTKAPGNDQPQYCDAGGNGYGCYELDFMEGNAQAIGTTFHLCGDNNRGNFMCQDDRCLSSKIPSKSGGDECDSWGCATNTKDLPDKDGQKAYGQGGYIDSSQNFKMSIYFEPSVDKQQLEHAWVKLAQGGKELIYKACDADNYIKAYTDAAKTSWTTQSTYWGGGDGMEWLNGPCWDAPGVCNGQAGEHVQNVKLFKAVA